MLPAKLDQLFIEELSSTLNVDYYDAEINMHNNADVTNDIIDYIYTEAIEQLQISEENKEYLKDNIYLNCLDSGINIPLEEVDDFFAEATEEEKEIIREFIEKAWKSL